MKTFSDIEMFSKVIIYFLKFTLIKLSIEFIQLRKRKIIIIEKRMLNEIKCSLQNQFFHFNQNTYIFINVYNSWSFLRILKHFQNSLLIMKTLCFSSLFCLGEICVLKKENCTHKTPYVEQNNDIDFMTKDLSV